MAVLKSQTRPEHDRVEAAMRVESSLASESDYRGLLLRFAAALLPVDAAIQAHPAASILPDLATRSIRGSLLRDLRSLGVPEDTLYKLSEVEYLIDPTPADLLGTLYTVEGSSLGGRVISRMVREAMPDAPVAYFDRYGDAIGERWGTLKTVVDGELVKPRDRDAAVAAAKAVFARFHEPLPEELVSRVAVGD